MPASQDPHSKEVLPVVQRESPVFLSVPTASCPGTGHHCKEPGFIAPSLQVFTDSGEIPWRFLQAKQAQFSQPLLTGVPVLCPAYSLGLSCTEDPDLSSVLQLRPQLTPWPAGHAVITQPGHHQLLCCRGMLLTHVQLSRAEKQRQELGSLRLLCT